MHIKNDTVINASPDQVVDFMLSDHFVTQLRMSLDAVTNIQEVDNQPKGDTTQHRVLQYEAPTQSKIPSFLSKYKDKAPDFVYWKEIATWDLNNHTMRYVIEPDIPEKWHSYYDVSGQLACQQKGDKTVLHTALTYNVNVFGLKRLIERALKAEVVKLLNIQGQIVKAHFNAR